MNSVLTQPRVEWVTAAPLWRQAANAVPAVQMRQPALLRFEKDTFMDDLVALLQSGSPADLARYVAAPVSYRARPLGQPIAWEAPPPAELKLYQPVQGHFNLVAATLVCQMPGLPDRVVDTAQDEQAGFVLRRLNAQGQELAWVTGPAPGWQPVAQPRVMAQNEELSPLFPLNFELDERKRRLLVGLIPTSARETFQAAPALALAAPSSEEDPRASEASARIAAPLEELKSTRSTSLSQQQQLEASRFILLDLADFLATQMPAVWNAIQTGATASTSQASLLVTLLTSTRVANSLETWTDGLKLAWLQRASITGESDTPPTLAFNLRSSPMNPDLLDLRIKNALAEAPASPISTALVATPVPKLDPRPDTRYVIRCVYRRPACGPLQPDVISDASQPFTIASFFDFDAPGRPIRITMPLDTSPAGLRKFRKNVSFVVSDKLRQQMEAVTDLKKVMDGDVQEGGIDLGVLCSFSIPIITICALIVLIIFINLLNIVFWWLPFFRICLPIKLKAK